MSHPRRQFPPLRRFERRQARCVGAGQTACFFSTITTFPPAAYSSQQQQLEEEVPLHHRLHWPLRPSSAPDTFPISTPYGGSVSRCCLPRTIARRRFPRSSRSISANDRLLLCRLSRQISSEQKIVLELRNRRLYLRRFRRTNHHNKRRPREEPRSLLPQQLPRVLPLLPRRHR